MVAVPVVALAPVTVNCTVALGIGAPPGVFSVAVIVCWVPATLGPAMAGARTSELKLVTLVTVVAAAAPSGP